jgi:hypothetical protein
LLSLDANDNFTVTADELLPLRDQLLAADGQTASRGAKTDYVAALHLKAEDNPARLEYLLNDLYAPRQSLTPTSFSALGTLGEHLDADGDGWIDRTELAELRSVKPHLKLTVSFEKSAAAGGRTATVVVAEPVPEVSVASQSSPGRTAISIGGVPILISASETSPSQYMGEVAVNGADAGGGRIRLLVHDQTDAVYAELDANSDGRLSEREMSTLAERLLARDADQNHELSGQELPYSMIAAFVHGEPMGDETFFVPSATPPPTAGPAPPEWFTHADLNADGDVSQREFLGAANQFAKVDSSHDGFITAEEAAQATAVK